MNAVFGKGRRLQDHIIIGMKYKEDCRKAQIGSYAVIRSGTIIYADVEIGDYFQTGHNVMIREMTKIGNRVVVGTNSVIDGNVEIGNFVKIETNVYIPTHMKIGNHVFIGPGAVFTNDKYPQRLRDEYEPNGPILEDSVTVGANSAILPGIRIKEGAIIGAGSVVTKDVPPWNFAIGNPATISPLPEKLREPNRAKRW
ncbi:MAG: N-acetyltransferase [Candidatus Heimdallarchaeota archaeon]|nr:MAG: N-acetyltransferase [Candidatus Heimdallarchaeota archaeon]